MKSNQEQELEIAELEHVVGYNGKFSNSIHFVPNSKNYFVYSIGGLIVLEDSEDQHNQRFLRGHDMAVSTLCVGSSGKLLASGQVGTIFAKTNDAPVILWDLQSLKPINIFKGLTGCVTQLSLSPDERFLAATGANNYFYIWNLEDFTQVVSKVSESPFTQIVWGPMKKAGKHPSYTIIVSNAHNIFVNYLEFDIGSMQYSIKGNPVQLPSTGLVRNYTCSAIDPNGEFFYAGTTGGEICIFNIPNLIFKAALPVSNNGVYSIVVENDTVYCGGGDGKLKKLVGKATKYSLDKEVLLDGRIVSLTMSNDGKELMSGTSAGKIFKSLSGDLSSTVHAEGHVEYISEVNFKRDSLDLFATIDQAGLVLVWDINNLNVLTRCIPNNTQKPKGRCVCIADDGTVVTGWEDGFIRCFEVSQKKFSTQAWEIVNAHRGAVTTVYCDENYILSGGDDGIVRVWARKTRKLITQITAHKKTITKVFPDVQKSNIIHSCSADKIIHSHDLKTEKKIILHQAKNGTVLSMAQRKDNELELITVGHNNPVSYWDCDVVDAVDSLDYPYKILTIDVSPSGKYMALGSETAEVLIFEVATKEFRGKFDGHSGPVTSLKFTPDEKQIVSVSSDSSLCIWNFFG